MFSKTRLGRWAGSWLEEGCTREIGRTWKEVWSCSMRCGIKCWKKNKEQRQFFPLLCFQDSVSLRLAWWIYGKWLLNIQEKMFDPNYHELAEVVQTVMKGLLYTSQSQVWKIKKKIAHFWPVFSESIYLFQKILRMHYCKYNPNIYHKKKNFFLTHFCLSSMIAISLILHGSVCRTSAKMRVRFLTVK